MKLGAYDYLTKPPEIEELDLLVRKAAREGRSSCATTWPSAAHAPEAAASGIVGRSAADAGGLRIVERVAPTELRRADHRRERHRQGARRARDPRAARRARERPFVAVNCAAMPRELLETELFGHEKGAFTGADRAKPGLLRAGRRRHALPRRDRRDGAATARSKLLRVLEERDVLPGRRHAPRARSTCALVAATNRDLSRGDQDGTVPRGPLLPPQRVTRRACRRCASAARTSRCSPEHFLAQLTPTHGLAAAQPGALRASMRLRLARQRPRAAARDPARR